MLRSVFVLCVTIIWVSFISCSEDNTEIISTNGNSTLNGYLKFLDESPASNAIIELKIIHPEDLFLILVMQLESSSLNRFIKVDTH